MRVPQGMGITVPEELVMLSVANRGWMRLLAVSALVAGVHGWAAAQVCTYNVDFASGFGSPGLKNGPDEASVIYDMVVYDNGTGPSLYVGGVFDTADGGTALGIARWDGVQWSQVQLGAIGAGVRALGVWDDGNGPALYVGGNFGQVGLTPANNIAKWDGANWSALGAGVDHATLPPLVTSICVYDDGDGEALYVCGRINSAGGSAVNGIAKWDGTTWTAVPGGINSGSVYAMAAYDDGTGEKLYMAGNITSVGDSVAVNRIATWDGQNWSDVNGGVLPTSSTNNIEDLLVWDDGGGEKLYMAGAANIGAVASWDGATITSFGNVSALDPNNGGWSFEIATFDDGTGEALYAAGAMATQSGSASVARWDGANWNYIAGYYPQHQGIRDGVGQEIIGFQDTLVLAGDFDTMYVDGVPHTQNAVSLFRPDCPCDEDLNGDGLRDSTDLAILLAHFGGIGSHPDGDVNGDGAVDSTDLARLLGAFGADCPGEVGPS